MSNLVKTEVFDGWELARDADGERRVRDLEIGARGGLAQPINVRKVIRSNRAELEAHGELVSRREITSGSLGKPAEVYWLNEDQSLALVALLRTDRARELRIGLVRLFGALRRRELSIAPTAIPLDVAHGPTVGEVPNLRLDIDAMCRMTARAAQVSLRRVHGFIRSTYRLGGIYQVSALAWPQVRLTLESLALGRIALPTARRALPPANKAQLSLLPGGAS